MPIEVPCPNCRSVLRAPDEAAGKRVKCRKCEHRFSVPGPEPAFTAEIVEDDSQFLSVVPPAPLPPAPAVQPAAVRPAVVVPAVVVPAPAAPVPAVVVPVAVESAPAPAADPGNPFAFNPKARPDDGDEDEPRSSRSRVVRKKAAGGPGKVLLVVGVLGIVFVVGATGAALAVYYLVAKPAATKTSALVVESVPAAAVELKPEKPVPEAKPAEPVKGKDAGKAKPGATGRPPRDKGKGGAAPQAAGVPKATAPVFPIPDAPAGPGKLIAPARDKIALEVPAAQIKAVAFGGKNPRAVAVFWAVFGGFQGSGAKDAIDVYSVATGRQSARFELPADGVTGPRAFDLSPDGTRVAVELPAGRLTVFDVDSKEKLLDGVDPFAGSPTPRAGLAGVKFVGSPDALAAVDKAGAVDLWDVKTKARTAGGRPSGTAGGAALALSDLSSQPLWLFAQGAVTEMSSQTAEPGVSVTVSDPAGAPLGVAIDSTGRKAAAAFRDAGTAHGFAVLDLRPGKYAVTDKLMLPEKAGVPSGVSLLGTGSVAAVQLADRSACLVFDAEHKVPAFYNKAASGPAVKHFGDAEADRLWWVVPDAADPKKSLLVSVDANFDDYQTLVAEAETAKKPLFLTPRADGLAK